MLQLNIDAINIICSHLSNDDVKHLSQVNRQMNSWCQFQYKHRRYVNKLEDSIRWGTRGKNMKILEQLTFIPHDLFITLLDFNDLEIIKHIIEKRKIDLNDPHLLNNINDLEEGITMDAEIMNLIASTPTLTSRRIYEWAFLYGHACHMNNFGQLLAYEYQFDADQVR